MAAIFSSVAAVGGRSERSSTLRFCLPRINSAYQLKTVAHDEAESQETALNIHDIALDKNKFVVIENHGSKIASLELHHGKLTNPN